MNEYITRHELDAKLSAAEERINAQIARIEAKIDAMSTRFEVINDKFDAVNQRLTDYREDLRSSKRALWVMAITVSIAALIPMFEKYEFVLK